MTRTTHGSRLEAAPTQPPVRRREFVRSAEKTLRKARMLKTGPKLDERQRRALASHLGIGLQSTPTTVRGALSALVEDVDRDGLPDLSLDRLAAAQLIPAPKDEFRATRETRFVSAARENGLTVEGEAGSARRAGDEELANKTLVSLVMVESSWNEVKVGLRTMDDFHLALQVIDAVRQRDGDYSSILGAARLLSGRISEDVDSALAKKVADTLMSTGLKMGPIQALKAGGYPASTMFSVVMSHARAALAGGANPALVRSLAGQLLETFGAAHTIALQVSAAPVMEGINILGRHASTFEAIEFEKFKLEALSGRTVPKGRATQVARLFEKAGSIKELQALQQAAARDLAARISFYEGAMDALRTLEAEAAALER